MSGILVNTKHRDSDETPILCRYNCFYRCAVKSGWWVPSDRKWSRRSHFAGRRAALEGQAMLQTRQVASDRVCSGQGSAPWEETTSV